jgi:hypothetical protein
LKTCLKCWIIEKFLFIIHNKMLVLNTNESWWWSVLSNEFILPTYPNFKNNILVFADWVVTWYPSVWTYWWMTFNCFSTNVVSPYYFVWTPNSWNAWLVWFWENSWWNTTITHNVLLDKELDAWMIVWRKITWWYAWLMVANNNNWNETIKLTIFIYLCHSDWTKTEVWRIELQEVYYSSDYRYSWTNQIATNFSAWKINPRKWSITTNWYIAQQWDKIWIKYNAYMQGRASSAHYSWVLLWRKYSDNDDYRYAPVEISYESA